MSKREHLFIVLHGKKIVVAIVAIITLVAIVAIVVFSFGSQACEDRGWPDVQ